MAAPLEFWFDFASPYSYLAAMRVEEACAGAAVPLVWKPFLLGPIFSAQLGIKDSPLNANPSRGRYVWRDVERLCAKLDLPLRKPSVFPRNGVRAARLACMGAGQSWIGAYVRAVFQANFSKDQEIADAEILKSVLSSLNLDVAEILIRAESPVEKSKLRANTDAATARGVFGGPTFFIGDEMFFGQDRLEEAIAWAGRDG
jgi:2-hydroxychromene-2-carboxylate isomerase